MPLGSGGAGVGNDVRKKGKVLDRINMIYRIGGMIWLWLSPLPAAGGGSGVNVFFWGGGCLDALWRFFDGINGIMGKLTGLKVGIRS